MADLKDLKKLNEEALPLLRRLFALAGMEGERAETTGEEKVLAHLRKLVVEARDPTDGSLEQRAETIRASRHVLTEVLIEDATRVAALTASRRRRVETQRNALAASFGRLLERATFEPIPSLLDAAELSEVEGDLERAGEEIDVRRRARDLLEIMVDMVITGARIAGRLA